MKNFLFALVAGCIITLTGVNGANAQNPVSPAPKKFSEMEKAMVPANDEVPGRDMISPRALRDFAKRCKNVTAERWVKVNGGYSANFISDGVSNSIFYNSHGKWLSSLRGYNEEKLPHEIRDIVKYEYHDYSIFYVQEIETIGAYGTPAYLIYLEGKNNFKVMRIKDGQADVMREIKKS